MFATKRSIHYNTVAPLARTLGHMTRPLIGISGRRWPASTLGENVPAAMRGLEFDLHFTDYPQSVALAGGLPVELTRDADADEMVAHLDGLVLTGGADLDPEHYHEAPDEDLGPLEPDRDAWEMALLAAARQSGIPVLAICRGLQLVNVVFGGTLAPARRTRRRCRPSRSGTSTATSAPTR